MIKEYYYDKHQINYSKEDKSESVKVGEINEKKELILSESSEFGVIRYEFPPLLTEDIAWSDIIPNRLINDKQAAEVQTQFAGYFAKDFDPIVDYQFGKFKSYYEFNSGMVSLSYDKAEVGDVGYFGVDVPKSLFQSDARDFLDQKVFIKYIFTQADYYPDTLGYSGFTEYVVEPKSIIYIDEGVNIYGTKDTLVTEDVIKDESYPKNGPKDGYWWVRKKEYTIPPPEIISPANGYKVNNNEGEDLPYFVFKLQPRSENDNNKYQARIRLGFRSDFVNAEIILESKDDQSQWEYYDGANWQPFPNNGVPAGTKVRVKPTEDEFEFGFYYWDVAAWHDFWGYGVNADHRLLVMITETDEVYFLTIGGRRHHATKLNVIESSNGELGQINLELVNNNI